MIFVDTNYFLRFLRADIADQYKKVALLFRAGAKGEKKLFTSTVVLFEIYWVLTSFYGRSKKEIFLLLDKILSMYFIFLEERDILKSALDFYKSTQFDLEDSYNIAYAKVKGAKEFKTFDKKLQRAFSLKK